MKNQPNMPDVGGAPGVVGSPGAIRSMSRFGSPTSKLIENNFTKLAVRTVHALLKTWPTRNSPSPGCA